jgi:hypothetical protein
LSADLAEFPCFYLNLPVVNLKLFGFYLQNNFCSHQVNSGKNSEIQLNQQTIIRQVLA